MAQLKSKWVYKYHELSDAAKQKAIDWYRAACAGDMYYSEYVLEDAARMAFLLGIELSTHTIPLMSGETRQEPIIYFSGFASQGDGACFEGEYSYKKGAIKAITDETGGTDSELIRIATELQEVQKEFFYSLNATMRHSSNHYYHSGCMTVETDLSDSVDLWGNRDLEDAAESVGQLMRDFADWIYKRLEDAYDYENSDEQIIESIIANAYEFDDTGERA